MTTAPSGAVLLGGSVRRSTRASRIAPWIVPVALAAAALLLAMLAAGDDGWHRAFDYRRNDIATGRWWQLATGHLMHWSTAHALLDAAATILVAWIFSTAWRPATLVFVSIAALASVDAGLWFVHPEVERYVGLSGVLHGWFAAGALLWLTGAGASPATRAWGAALCVGLVVKLVLEATGHAFWLAGADFPVVTAAHRWGAAGGALCGLALAGISRRPDAAASDASPVR